MESKLTKINTFLKDIQPPAASDVESVTVSQAESLEEAARKSLEAVSTDFNEAKVTAGNARVQVTAAVEELAAVKATLNDPARARRKSEASGLLTDALAHQSQTQEALDELTRQLQSVNLPVLQQDVERLDLSSRQAELAHSQRATDITRLEVELQTKGALGLEETASEKQRELDHVERRRVELERRANALDHLLKILRARRSELGRRLRAPLQKHLTHYLQILFPGSHIEVGDDLSPGRFSRPVTSGLEMGEFAEFSIGTREQMGVVARLAYADLLKAAGKPTLLILDDALVHTDDERLGRMKRVLYDAANRHQLLIFTCHPEAWRDLGAIPRNLT